MADYGNLDTEADEKWENPVEDYLENKADPPIDDQEGITDDRLRQLRSAINDSPESSDWRAWDEFHDDWLIRGNPENTDKTLTTGDGQRFYNQMRDAGLAKSTAIGHLQAVQEFLEACMERGIIDGNPVAYTLDQLEPASNNKDYPEKTVDDIAEFINWISDPQYRAAVTTTAKWGVRKGENCNIDLPYLHLDSPLYRDYLDERGIELHEEVVDHPDSVYIPPLATNDEIWRGERRSMGNKGDPDKKSGKLLPVDHETKRVLLDWLAIRRDTGYPYPLWVSSNGDRPHKSRWSNVIGDYMDDYGFVPEGKEMDPVHYFRHFFTTNMQEGEGTHGAELSWHMVQILRGDSGGQKSNKNIDSSDLHATYTHDWGNQIRQPYLKNIYQFNIY